MRRVRALLGVWAVASAWLGCNLILGNESAVFAPLDATTNEGDSSVDPPGTDGSTDVFDPGPCVNTDTNARHCGRCNHDCIGGKCVGGQCQPFVVATDVEGPAAIAIDETHVYWTNKETGDVLRAPKTGGATEKLYAGEPQTSGDRIALFGSDIYFTVAVLDGGVLRCPKTGCNGAPTYVVPKLDVPSSVFVAPSGEILFAETVNDGRVARCTPPCTLLVVVANDGFPSHVSMEGDGVFWTRVVPDFSMRAREGAGIPETLLTGAPYEVIATPTEVFWADRSHGIAAYDRSTGTRRRVRVSPTDTMHLFLHDGGVFFTEESKGNVIACPVVGCDAGEMVLAIDQGDPRGIAADEKAIYWANASTGSNTGAIMGLAR